jgi:hypothetical protein
MEHETGGLSSRRNSNRDAGDVQSPTRNDGAWGTLGCAVKSDVYIRAGQLRYAGGRLIDSSRCSFEAIDSPGDSFEKTSDYCCGL